MIINSMKILFYHLTKKTNKKGLAPIYVRVTIAGQRKEYSTGVYIFENQWQDGQIVNHDNANALNVKLTKIKADIYDAAIDVNKNAELSVYSLQQNLDKNNTKHIFINYLNKFVAQKCCSGSICSKTIEKLKIAEKHILNFLSATSRSGINVEQVDCVIANKLIIYCEHNKKFGKEHTAKILGLMRQTLSYCVTQGVIKHNVLNELEYKRSKPKPIVALTELELEKLESFEFKKHSHNLVRDLYLLCCYTGLCYIDLMNFDKEKLKEIDSIKIYDCKRQKSGTEAIIPLNKKAILLFTKYNFEIPKICNQTFNRYIKEIACILEINKKLTSHTGRKTFGMISINKGYSFESLAKMMGHSSTKITQSVYSKVQTDRVLNEFRLFM